MCISVVILTITILHIQALEFELDNLKGSKDKNLLTIDYSVPKVKVAVMDNEIQFYSGEISKLNSLDKFLETSKSATYNSFHYGIFQSCTLDIEDNKDNSPMLLSLKNPLTGDQYYFELNFLPNEPNSVKPRSDIKQGIEDKCNKLRGTLKEDLNTLKDKIAKLTKSAKLKNDATEKTRNADAQVPMDNNEGEIKRLTDQLTKLKSKLAELKQKKVSTSSDSSDSLKDQSQAASQIKANEDKLTDLTDNIKKIQDQIKDLEAQKKQLQGKLPKEVPSDKETDKKAKEAVNQKREENAKAKSDLDLKTDEVVQKSQKAQKLQGTVDQTEKELNEHKKTLQDLENSKTKEDAQKKASDARITSDKCNADKKKYETDKKTIQDKKADIQNLTTQKSALLKDANTVKYNKIQKSEESNDKAKNILTELDSCFNFRTGFINEAKKAFYNHSKDSINFAKSIKPNDNDYNMVDKIYTAAVANPCGMYKTQLQSVKKDNKKRQKEERKIRKEEELRKIGKTAFNGLLYSGQEIGRTDRILEYVPYGGN